MMSVMHCHHIVVSDMRVVRHVTVHRMVRAGHVMRTVPATAMMTRHSARTWILSSN
jgi:hypothetical protein